MKSSRGFLGLFDTLIDRILCVAGAVLFSQGPEFMQQYLQRLGGHLDEARRHLATFEQTATQAGLTLDRFITQTGANADPAVAKLSGVMTDVLNRAGTLQAAQDALLKASLWERPFVFARHLDLGIARATGAVYQPAMPTTAEGLIYALTGMLVLLALYHFGFKRLIALFGRRGPARPAPARTAA
ncbi:MAG: DUF2937 family protein [Rhizobiales bacterium]|nr:DUF2937 family protein [Hyphomicrobiales bacterium]